MYGYDMRNPYGARGGYVRDMRGGRYDRGDMDYGYDMRRGNRGMDYNDMDYAGRDYAIYDQRGDYGYYGMDRHGSDMLDERTLEMWSRELLNELEPMHQQKFKMDAVIKKAEEMGIRFDKFTPAEFYATVVMIASDFGKTVGMNNIDLITRMAKDWLCDPDAGVKYGKKLSAYYHHIANV